MKINIMIWICIVLLAVLIFFSFAGKAHPSDTASVDTLLIKEANVVLVIFSDKDQFLVDYNWLFKNCKKNDLTPKPTPTPEPYYPHYPLRPQE